MLTTTARTLLVVCLLAGAAFAQPPQDPTAIVTAVAPIYIYPDTGRTPLRTAAINTTLKVLEEQGEWVRVEFQDPQFGRRVGWVQAKNVRIARPEQTPMDLSIRPEAPPATAAPSPRSEGQRAAAGASTVEHSQTVTSPGRGFARGWVDANFGVATPRAPNPTFTDVTTVSLEDATFTAQYHWKTGVAINFGGGVMLTRNFGLGVSFQGTGHTGPADISIRIPHPLTFNRYATDSGKTKDDQTRGESMVHIQAMVVSDASDALRFRFYAGPTIFRLQQDVVDDITYDQTYTTAILGYLNAVDITGYDTSEIEYSDGSGWGFHAGGDVSWFFTRVVGVGGFGTYSYGKLKTYDPLTLEDGEFKMGGFQAGGGLRLRF